MALVKITGAEKAKCLNPGQEYEVESAVAEKLYKKGEAVKPKAAKAE